MDVPNKATAEGVTTLDWAGVAYVCSAEHSSFYDAGPQNYRIVTASVYRGAIQPLSSKCPRKNILQCD